MNGMRIKPDRRVGSRVIFSPRPSGVRNEDYSAADLTMLRSFRWTVWSLHPKPGWVWLVNEHRKTIAAAFLDLEGPQP